jgi:dipeptidase D
MQKVLSIFEEISRIPRCSGREERIAAFLTKWADARGFAVKADAAGNLLITVPASAGRQQAPAIVLQCHMDMVCEKTPDSSHDFARDPLQLIYDGDRLKAAGTTLGADNGAGLAIALALADDRDLVHPLLEILCTVDEESGLTGANALAPGFFTGRILLNLDSEDEGVFTIGCAGGRNIELLLPLRHEAAPVPTPLYELRVHGLRGGHSGINIHEQRGNANVLLARLLARLRGAMPVWLAAIEGGSAHNAIPRDAAARLAVLPADEARLAARVAELAAGLRAENRQEPNLAVSLHRTADPAGQVLSPAAAATVGDLLLAAPDGVMAMAREVAGLVDTSVNFATIRSEAGALSLLFSLRSVSPTGIEWLTARMQALAALAGAVCRPGNGYPGWQPDMESELLARARKVYRDLFASEPVIQIIHAGLECGIIGAKYPGLEMVSIGPTIKNPHSPDETLVLPTLEKVRRFTAALIASYGGE